MSNFEETLEIIGGAEGNRTPDLLHAMQALSRLSYGPLEVSMYRKHLKFAPPKDRPEFNRAKEKSQEKNLN